MSCPIRFAYEIHDAVHTQQLAEALIILGSAIEERNGARHKALPLLMEGLALLRSKPPGNGWAMPTHLKWVDTFERGAQFVGRILMMSGRLEEAVAVLEEAVGNRDTIASEDDDDRSIDVRIMLAEALLEMGDCGRAIAVGEATLPLLDRVDACPPDRRRLFRGGGMLDRSRIQLHATLTSVYEECEELGEVGENICLMHHFNVLRLARCIGP